MTLDFLALDGDVETIEAPPDTQGMDVDARDRNGLTPFLAAVEEGCLGNVELLMGLDGIDLNVKDRQGVSS
jgi:ankyrin repeat protein